MKLPVSLHSAPGGGGGVSVSGSTLLGAAEAVPAVIAAKISASTPTIKVRRKVTFMFFSLILSSIALVFLLWKAGNSSVPSLIINFSCLSHGCHLLRHGVLDPCTLRNHRYTARCTSRSSGLTALLARATNLEPLDPRSSCNRSSRRSEC